jgi:xylan 1,4-beta-xylosidase
VDLDLVLGQHEVTLVELLPVTPDEHEGLDDALLLGVVG